MDKAENQYRINMAIEVERLATIPIFGGANIPRSN